MERDVKIKGQLRDSKETRYYRKYINYIHGGDLNEIGKYWKDRVPNWFSLVTKSSSVGTGLYLIDLLYNGVPWESSNNQGCCQDNKQAALHRNGIKISYPKTTPTQLTDQGKVELVLAQSLHSYILESSIHKDPSYTTKREI